MHATPAKSVALVFARLANYLIKLPEYLGIGHTIFMVGSESVTMLQDFATPKIFTANNSRTIRDDLACWVCFGMLSS